MRKIILQVQISVDGYIAGPNGEMDWLIWNWDEALQQYVKDLMADMDLILLGRKLAEGFIPHWAAVASDPASPEYAAGKVFTDTPKVVFSKTLDHSQWSNTNVSNGDLAAEVNRLKQAGGKDILVYGGADFVSALIREGLIDEYHLFVNPDALGAGLPIFQAVNGRHKLSLITARTFSCGIVVLHYQPKKEA